MDKRDERKRTSDETSRKQTYYQKPYFYVLGDKYSGNLIIGCTVVVVEEA